MVSLIKKILKEESEVKEMGIKLDKLVSKQPQNYLVQSLKRKEKELKQREKENRIERQYDELKSQLENLYKEIRETIKGIHWSELYLYLYSNGHYYVKLPKKIVTISKVYVKLFSKLDDMYRKHNDNLSYFDVDRKYSKMNRDLLDSVIESHDINLYLDSDIKNRTHFPEGLPQSFLGLNLGYKIYRNMIGKLGFIQSGSDASESAQKIYRQLIQDPDLNCVITKYGVIVFDKSLSKEEKLKNLGEFIFDKHTGEIRKTPFVLDKDIFFDSSLSSQIGRSKIDPMLRNIFKFIIESEVSKDPYKEPYVFEKIKM